MSSILPQARRIFLTDLRGQPNPKRKLDYRWELAQVEETLVLVNTQVANKVAQKLLHHNDDLRAQLGLTPGLVIKDEATTENEDRIKSRFDFGFLASCGRDAYLEVKQVTPRVADQDGRRWAAFPDAVSARGQRHLLELARLSERGHPTYLLYIVGRNDVDAVRAAHEVDAEYARALRVAVASGVKVFAARIRATVEGLFFDGWLPVLDPVSKPDAS